MRKTAIAVLALLLGGASGQVMANPLETFGRALLHSAGQPADTPEADMALDCARGALPGQGDHYERCLEQAQRHGGAAPASGAVSGSAPAIIADSRAGTGAGGSSVSGASEPDTVRMKNGDVFTGRVLVDTLSVTTAYGLVTLPRNLLSEVGMTGEGQNVESMVGVGGDRFSGFLMEQTLPVELAAGNRLTLRKERVATIRFQEMREGARHVVRDAVVMRNTDRFQARITTPEFVVETSYGVLSFAQDDIASIEFEGDARVIAKVTLRGDKGSFQGGLRTEEIALRTRAGQAMTVYRDKFQRIDFAAVAAAPDPVASDTAGRSPAGSGAPVSGQYALVLRTTQQSGTVPYSVAVDVNGQPVGVFTGQRMINIESHLRLGANSLRFTLNPITGLSGNNHLLIKAGPASGRSFVPEFTLATAGLSAREGRAIEVPYYVLPADAQAPAGEFALFATARNRDANLPLVSDISIDGRHVASVTGPIAGLPIAGLEPGRLHTVRIVTRRVDGLGGQNWLNLAIGRVSSVRDGNYQYASLLEISNHQGWQLDAGPPRPLEGGRDTVVIELPLSL